MELKKQTNKHTPGWTGHLTWSLVNVTNQKHFLPLRMSKKIDLETDITISNGTTGNC